MVPTVRESRGFKKSEKVMECQVKWRGSGKVGEFKSTGVQKSIIVFSIYILALKSDI